MKNSTIKKIEIDPQNPVALSDWGIIRDKYTTVLQMKARMSGTKNLAADVGRGAGKSTEIFAERFVKISFDMAGSLLLLAAPTYVFIMDTIVPALITYLANNYTRGLHYEYGKRPPKHFKTPYVEVERYQHTITFAWGTIVQFISVDRPESAIGKNSVHVFVDETLRMPEDLFRERIIPALRSNKGLFGGSPYYGGMTLTSSTPNLETDHDWWMQYEQFENPENTRELQYVSYRVMKAQGEIVALEMERATASVSGNLSSVSIDRHISRLTNFINRWIDWGRDVRKQKPYWWTYIKGSSFSNLAWLGLEYMEQQLMSSGSNLDKFKLSILGIRPEAVKDKFFARFSPSKHTFTDSYKYKFTDGYREGDVDLFSIDKSYQRNSRDLKYCKEDAPLVAGYDPGNFSSIVFGQETRSAQYRELRIIKNFWAYLPEEHAELAEKITSFFRDHQRKTIYLHYDRAANKRLSKYAENSKGKTDAEILKRELESRGWTVHLESIKQRTIFLWEHFFLLSVLFGEKNPKAPRVKICQNEAGELVSSIQMSPVRKTTDSFIDLDKSSETRLDYEDQVLWSTQIGTSLMYLLWGLYNDLKPKGEPESIHYSGL
jgi:hypothetical protein